MNSRDFVDHVLELARASGPASVRAMFGAHGLYLDGIIIGIIDDDTLWLKCDAQSLPSFEARDLPPFEYVAKDGSRTMTAYRLAPEEALESPPEMREWLRLAQGAALRAAAAKRPSARRAKARQPP